MRNPFVVLIVGLAIGFGGGWVAHDQLSASHDKTLTIAPADRSVTAAAYRACMAGQSQTREVRAFCRAATGYR